MMQGRPQLQPDTVETQELSDPRTLIAAEQRYKLLKILEANQTLINYQRAIANTVPSQETPLDLSTNGSKRTENEPGNSRPCAFVTQDSRRKYLTAPLERAQRSSKHSLTPFPHNGRNKSAPVKPRKWGGSVAAPKDPPKDHHFLKPIGRPLRSSASVKVRNSSGGAKCQVPPSPTAKSGPGKATVWRKTSRVTNVKKVKWNRVRSPLGTAGTSSSNAWFPISKASPTSEPNFFPVEKMHMVKGSDPPPSLKFPWKNSLNRIFLQEGKPDPGDSDQSAASQTQANVNTSADSGYSPSGSEEPASNPFKTVSQPSWSPPRQDEGSDVTRSILLPAKLGSSSRKGDVGRAILKPSALGESRMGCFRGNLALGGIGRPSGSAPAGCSSESCSSKLTFKLKPSVLGGAPAPSISPQSKPFLGISSDMDSVESSSLKQHELETDSKRLCLWGESGDRNAKGAERVNGNETSSAADGNIDRSPPAGVLSAPSFVPLALATCAAADAAPDESSRLNGLSTPNTSNWRGRGFIFGQNLHSRVAGVTAADSEANTNGETTSPGGNLFTEAATSLSPTTPTPNDGAKSLYESSREFSEKEQSLKRKYEEVEVVTGEENEKNVIQMNCKLYSWVNGSWQERGRGILRLNDREVRDELHSRLVIRTQGTLTVMLNAKIFAEMSIEKSNDKSVRFTATSADGQPKIYLVMGSQKDITLLHNSLEYRVAAARSQSLDERERKELAS